jgi:hypothetical protein
MIVQLGEGQSLSTIFHNLHDLPTSIQSTYVGEFRGVGAKIEQCTSSPLARFTVENVYWITWLPARGFAGELQTFISNSSLLPCYRRRSGGVD